jgi:2,3-dihydroxybiphenyl 1,2-dioxygenase
MGNDVRLGYLGFEVRELAAWEAFAVDVLGLEIAARDPSGVLALRCDDWAQRFVVSPGPGDDVAFFGWEVDDESALEAAAARLRAASVETLEGSEAEARARRVARLLKVRDPSGHPCEIFFGADRATTVFGSRHVRSSFVTGALGLGHVVVGAVDSERSQHFYRDLLGFRLSDRIACEVYGYPVDIVFMHGGRRHHSVAIGGQQRKRIHHFMLEVASMDDVGLAFDRALRGGARIMQTLGRHPNDRMFSFYAKTPSGFQFEIGWGGREVDDATWQPTTYDHISEWGHHPFVASPSMPKHGHVAEARREGAEEAEKTNERTNGPGGKVRGDR